MVRKPLSLIALMLIVAYVGMPGCQSHHGLPTSPSDDYKNISGPVIDIFAYLGNPKFTRKTGHPFVGADNVTRHSAGLIDDKPHTSQRNGQAIYNWELHNSLDTTGASVAGNWVLDGKLYYLQSDGLTSWGQGYNWDINMDAYYAQGVTHAAFQEISVSSSQIQASKIYYSRWNGNITTTAPASDQSGPFWVTPTCVSDCFTAWQTEFNVTPAVAVNDYGDVLVVWNTHDSLGTTGLTHPDNGLDAYRHTYSMPVLGPTVQLHAAVLQHNETSFKPLLGPDGQPWSVPGAYPDVAGFRYPNGNIGFLLVYEDEEMNLGSNSGYFIYGATITPDSNGHYAVSPPRRVNIDPPEPGNYSRGFLPAIETDDSFVYIIWYEYVESSPVPGDPVGPLHVSEAIASIAYLGTLASDAYWTQPFKLSPDVTVPFNRILRHPGLAVDRKGKHAVTWASWTASASPENKVWVQVYDGGWWATPVVKAPDHSYNRDTVVDDTNPSANNFPSVSSYINRHYRDVILWEQSAYHILGCDGYQNRQRWPSEVEFRDPDVALDSAGGINIDYTILFRLGVPSSSQVLKMPTGPPLGCDQLWDPNYPNQDPEDSSSSATEGDRGVFYESDCAYWNGSVWTVRDIFPSDQCDLEGVPDSFAKAEFQTSKRGILLDQWCSDGIDRSPGGGYALGLMFHSVLGSSAHLTPTTPTDCPTVNGLASAPIVRTVQDNVTVILSGFSNHNNFGRWNMNNSYLNETPFAYNSSGEVPFVVWLPGQDRADSGPGTGNNNHEWPSPTFQDVTGVAAGVAPDFACDNIGNTYLAYSSRNSQSDPWHIWVKRRGPDGQWDAPVDVSGSGSQFNDELPAIATSPLDGSVHLVWQRRSSSGSDSLSTAYDIIYVTSSDQGRSWSPLVVVSIGAPSYRGDCDIAVDNIGIPHIVWMQINGLGGNITQSKIVHACQQNSWANEPVSDPALNSASYPSIMPQIACDKRLNAQSSAVVVWTQWGFNPFENPIPPNYRRYYIARRCRPIGSTWPFFSPYLPTGYAVMDEPPDPSKPHDQFLGPRIDINGALGMESLAYFHNNAGPKDIAYGNTYGNLSCGQARLNLDGSIKYDATNWEIAGTTNMSARQFPCCQRDTLNFYEGNPSTFADEIRLFCDFPAMDVDGNGIPQVAWSSWEHHLIEPTYGMTWTESVVGPELYSISDNPRYVISFDELKSYYFDWNETDANINYNDPYRPPGPGNCGVALTSDDPDHSLGGPLSGVETPINNSVVACDPQNRVHIAFVVDSSINENTEKTLGPPLQSAQGGIVDTDANTGALKSQFLSFIFYQYNAGTPVIWYTQKTESDTSW